MLVLSVSWGQGLKGMVEKGQAKLKAIQEDIIATFQLYEIKTNPEFKENSKAYNITKRTLVAPDRKITLEETNTEKKFLFFFKYNQLTWEPVDNRTADDIAAEIVKGQNVKHQYTNFGDIGPGITINNLNQGYYKEDWGKSNFWTSHVSRFYSFEVTEGSTNTVCECNAETSRKVIWPLFAKNRGFLKLLGKPGPHWFRNLTQKLENRLVCEIYNGSEKYDLELDYSTYKDKPKLTIKQRVVRTIVPVLWRDEGHRIALQGTLKNDNKTYNVNTNYDYDMSVFKQNSPFHAVRRPTAYTVKDENDNFVLVKNGNHFRIANDVDQSSSQGILYGAILSAYFYKPLGGKGGDGDTYRSNNEWVGKYTQNTAAGIGQTVTYVATTDKGKKKAENMNKNAALSKRALEAQAKADDMTKSLQPEKLRYDPKDKTTKANGVPGYINERDNMDIFYNARLRGPLGLY